MAVENCDQPVKIHKIGKFRKLVKKTPSNFEMPVAARQQIRWRFHPWWALSDSGDIYSILILFGVEVDTIFSFWNGVDKDSFVAGSLWQSLDTLTESAAHIRTGIIIVMFSQGMVNIICVLEEFLCIVLILLSHRHFTLTLVCRIPIFSQFEQRRWDQIVVTCLNTQLFCLSS